MHSISIHTIRCSGRLGERGSAWEDICPWGCLPRGCLPKGSAWGEGVCSGGCLPRRSGCLPRVVSAWGYLPRRVCPRGCLPWGCPPCDQNSSHACENITFPQLRMRTVTKYTKIKHDSKSRVFSFYLLLAHQWNGCEFYDFTVISSHDWMQCNSSSFYYLPKLWMLLEFTWSSFQ